MTKLEKQVANILAVEFVRTGVLDCPRLARLVCKAILLAAGIKPPKQRKAR